MNNSPGLSPGSRAITALLMNTKTVYGMTLLVYVVFLCQSFSHSANETRQVFYWIIPRTWELTPVSTGPEQRWSLQWVTFHLSQQETNQASIRSFRKMWTILEVCDKKKHLVIHEILKVNVNRDLVYSHTNMFFLSV